MLQLWREYKRTADVRLRDRLVFTYAPLVKYLAYSKVKELPARCEIDDFISCGLEALIVSIDRYDPDRGASLEQFAWTRIHGAIVDELRRHDWAPRSVRRWEREIRGARERFAIVHGRRPTSEELATSLAIEVDDLRRWEHDIQLSDVTSLNTLVLVDDDAEVERIGTIASSDHSVQPHGAAERSDAKDRFRAAFRTLPPRDREVAVLLYVKELTLREIGEIIGVSESRVSQIHTQIKRALRSMLADDAELLASVA
ncbi:MAG: FliA/WhiG family RNA polymerase sigma factor [Actinobacteria bacterium]|nr:FliA/WhiG family RNA polymerase sigma factor [Actinomycetota bacterium]